MNVTRAIIGVIVLVFAVAGDHPPPFAGQDPLGVFETVWNTVNDTYFDASFGGIDWRKAHDRYRPLVAAAKTDADFYALVNAMLWELKASHTALIPPGLLSTVEPAVFGIGGIGISVRMLDGQAVITTVDPRSPAHAAGLRAGFTIQAIDGIPVPQLVEQVKRDRPPYNDRGRVAQITKGVMSRIYGAPETGVALAYVDEAGRRGEQSITRAKRNGATVGPNVFLAVEFEARRVDDAIGYLRLNTLQPPLVAQVSGAIRSMGNLAGLVIDLRGNSGGEIEGMPDLFLAEKTLLYVRKDRKGEAAVFSDPSGSVYHGPLAVVIDVTSGSAAELFAACLQAAGRAIVVGDRSPGAVLESDVIPLPTGALLMHPVAQPRTPDGTILEGRGVIPNVEVELRRDMLLKGVDTQLDAALTHLRTHAPKKEE